MSTKSSPSNVAISGCSSFGMRGLADLPRRIVARASPLARMARHLGISDEEALQAVVIGLARRLILTDGGEPPHSVALFRGLRESDE